jgi:hypothetical protein
MAKVVKRKIVVEVGYYYFYFDDLVNADVFAMIAKTHFKDEDSARVVRLTVDYNLEEQEEEDKEVVYTDTDSIKIKAKDEDIEDIEEDDEEDDQTTD